MTGRPTDWPSEAMALAESADLQEAILGRLLMAQWQQRHAGFYLTHDRTTAHMRPHYAEAQRRAFRDMTAARLALNALPA